MAWCGVNEHQVVGGDAHGEMRLFDIRRAGTLHSFDHSEASVDPECADTCTKAAEPDNRCAGYATVATAYDYAFCARKDCRW